MEPECVYLSRLAAHGRAHGLPTDEVLAPSSESTAGAGASGTLYELTKLCGVEAKSHVLCGTHGAIKALGTTTLPQALLDSPN